MDFGIAKDVSLVNFFMRLGGPTFKLWLNLPKIGKALMVFYPPLIPHLGLYAPCNGFSIGSAKTKKKLS